MPTTLTTSPSRMLEPMASQWASNAPTGMGMPARRPSSLGPLRREMAGEVVGGEVFAADLGADAGEERIDGDEELLRRQAAPLGIPHPLVAHGADAALELVDGR